MGKLLITGAGGFIGSHLAEKCVEQGFDVRAFLHYNSANSWGNLETSPVRNRMDVVTGDIRDYDSIYNAMKGCEGVFHLAALIGIPYSYVSPLAYVKTNIEGTYNILQAGRELKLKNIIITSTSETYGSAQYVPIDEKHPMVGQSPYSATKIGADQLAISFHRSFDLPVKIVRPFNTYGPRQSARAIIPSVISQILAGKSDIKLGNIAPTRDLTFVKDTAMGFIEIYRSETLFGEAANIGMNEEISIENLIKLISDLMNVKVRIISDGKRIRPKFSEVERLMADNAKIKKQTNWSPEYDLRKGLLETIEWMKYHKEDFKPELYGI